MVMIISVRSNILQVTKIIYPNRAFSKKRNIPYEVINIIYAEVSILFLQVSDAVQSEILSFHMNLPFYTYRYFFMYGTLLVFIIFVLQIKELHIRDTETNHIM